jgi:hypothetical protein
MMRRRTRLVVTILFTAAFAFCAELPKHDELAAEVETLVLQLSADDAATRDSAGEALQKLAGNLPAQCDRVLELLPQPTPAMPPDFRTRLTTLRIAIDKQIAESAMRPSQLELDIDNVPLAEVFAKIEQLTGNKLIDYRQQFSQESKPITPTLKTSGTFWEVTDRLLDLTSLDIYPFANEPGLAIINREANASSRLKRACYAGPFRIEPLEVIASRKLREQQGDSLKLELDIAWEPRLAPIAISQPLAEVVAVSETGARLSALQPEQDVDLEVQPGSRSVQVTLPLLLPSRETIEIASLKGKLQVLAPGRQVELEFAKLDEVKKPITQQRGGVSVTLEKVFKNNAVWELHMRLKLDNAKDALASHRGWVFENRSYLIGEDGKPIDHAGFETLMQTQNEVGLAYFFELPESGVKGLKWKYHTPASILEFPVEYELKGIKLP